VLLAGEGRPATETAERVGCSRTVKTWRSRYERDGVEGLGDLAQDGGGR
jgi:transposase